MYSGTVYVSVLLRLFQLKEQNEASTQAQTLIILIWMCYSVDGAKLIDPDNLREGGGNTLEVFIADIVRTWKLLSPTVILSEEIPHLCMRHEMMLCITNKRAMAQ